MSLKRFLRVYPVWFDSSFPKEAFRDPGLRSRLAQWHWANFVLSGLAIIAWAWGPWWLWVPLAVAAMGSAIPYWRLTRRAIKEMPDP